MNTVLKKPQKNKFKTRDKSKSFRVCFSFKLKINFTKNISALLRAEKTSKPTNHRKNSKLNLIQSELKLETKFVRNQSIDSNNFSVCQLRVTQKSRVLFQVQFKRGRINERRKVLSERSGIMFDKPEFVSKHMVILSGSCTVYLSNAEIKGHFTPHLLIFYIKLNPNQIIGLDKK